MLFDSLILVAIGALGATLTFFVNEHLQQGPIRSSAVLSLIVALFFRLFPHCLDANLVKNIPVVFICGSFAGMVSAKLLSSYLKIGLAGMICAVIYLNTSHFFNGYGGALGTAASISVLAMVSLPFLKRKS